MYQAHRAEMPQIFASIHSFTDPSIDTLSKTGLANFNPQ